MDNDKIDEYLGLADMNHMNVEKMSLDHLILTKKTKELDKDSQRSKLNNRTDHKDN